MLAPYQVEIDLPVSNALRLYWDLTEVVEATAQLEESGIGYTVSVRQPCGRLQAVWLHNA